MFHLKLLISFLSLSITGSNWLACLGGVCRIDHPYTEARRIYSSIEQTILACCVCPRHGTKILCRHHLWYSLLSKVTLLSCTCRSIAKWFDRPWCKSLQEKEWVIFYLIRRLLDPKTRYSPIEKLCLCLYFSCTELRHYLLSAECTVVSKADVIKHMLSMPILNGRMGKWILALSEFDLRYKSAKAGNS